MKRENTQYFKLKIIRVKLFHENLSSARSWVCNAEAGRMGEVRWSGVTLRSTSTDAVEAQHKRSSHAYVISALFKKCTDSKI